MPKKSEVELVAMAMQVGWLCCGGDNSLDEAIKKVLRAPANWSDEARAFLRALQGGK